MKYHLAPFILIFITLFSACHKKSELEILKANLQKPAKFYVENELEVKDADSVIIHQIDTITPLGYAKINLELLENMEFNYQFAYKEASLQNDQDKLTYLELYLKDVHTAEDFFKSKIENEKTDGSSLLLYMVTASYFKNGKEEPFTFFALPDFTVHVLDPFGDNILES
ncbi:MAG: hypothetical protein RR356_02165 [Bacteroidales bacterium]